MQGLLYYENEIFVIIHQRAVLVHKYIQIELQGKSFYNILYLDNDFQLTNYTHETKATKLMTISHFVVVR